MSIRARDVVALLALLASCADTSVRSESPGAGRANGSTDPWESARARLAVDQAERWIASGRQDLAEVEMERARALDCRSPDLAVLEARLALAKGDIRQVEASLDRARANGTDGAPVELLRGMLSESRMDWNAALESYASARQSEPTLVAAWTGEVRALMALGRKDAALACAEKALLQTEGAPTVYAALGYTLVSVGRFAEARDAYQRAMSIDREDPALLAAYLLACYQQGDYGEVMRLGARIPEKDCPAWFFEIVGRSALRTGDLVLAEAALARHLQAQPRDVSAWLDLGRTRLLREDVEGASQAVAVALQLAPDDPSPRTLLGHVRMRAGRGDEAIASYMDALERGEDPHEVRPLIESLVRNGGRAPGEEDACDGNSR